jgi:hypothetical protein
MCGCDVAGEGEERAASSSVADVIWLCEGERRMGQDKRANDFEDVLARVDACDDPRQGLIVVEETVTKLSADGRQVPENLIRLWRALQRDLVAQSQGR